MIYPVRKLQSFSTKGLDRSRGRTSAPEGTEELPNAFLNTQIRIQAYFIVDTVFKSDRKPHLQFPAARLVEDASAQPCPQHMQFRLAHRALQSQQQAVIEIDRKSVV